jgi:hypothetical protein
MVEDWLVVGMKIEVSVLMVGMIFFWCDVRFLYILSACWLSDESQSTVASRNLAEIAPKMRRTATGKV